MSGQLTGQPVIILDKDKTRTQGRDAQSMNIAAAKAVAAAVRSTLGPKGMDKMLVNQLGDVVITNDGAEILKSLDIKHPTAKMVAEVAKTQDDIAGDGTTTAVVLTGELLNKAAGLIEQNVHPTIITRGYKLAAERAGQILNEIAVSTSDDDVLKKIALTSLYGKSTGAALDILAGIAVDAARAIIKEGKADVEKNINILHQRGGSIKDTEFIHGLVIDKARAHKNMPKKIENARIAVLDTGIESQKKKDAKVKITSPGMIQQAIREEHAMVEEQVDSIARSGANVIFTEKGIDDLGLHYLSKKGILAIRRCKDEEIKKVVSATGARVVSSLRDIEENELGRAGIVEERGVGEYKLIYIENCENPKAVSIIVHGGADHVTEEIERGLHDALKAVQVVIEDGKILPGGGASEVEVAHQIRKFAASVGGREQLAIQAFADALEEIPKAIAENAGLDAIDKLAELRSAHEKGTVTAGLNAYTGDIVDMFEQGIVDPLRVKDQAIKSAVDTAVMILRIDDMLMAKQTGMMDVKPEHRADYYDGISPPDVEQD